MRKKRIVYLDHAATTPTDPRVRRVMNDSLRENFGNPGSLHQAGQKSSASVFKSRRQIADSIDADYKELIFTGSATEANNLALCGAAENFYSRSRFQNRKPKARIIVSAIEHESVQGAARELEKKGFEIITLPVLRSGLVDLGALKRSLDKNTILVSVGYANNEVGVVQPIAEIAEIIRRFKDKNEVFLNMLPTSPRTSNSPTGGSNKYPLFHTDAVQAFQYLNCAVSELGVDFMTLSAHKIYGPKGIGALYVRLPGNKKEIGLNSYPLKPLIFGGGQEFGLRSGTENVAAIAGFAEAVKIAKSKRDQETMRLAKLRDYFFNRLKKINSKLKINGSRQFRLPNNLNIYFPDVDVSTLLTELDLNGVAAAAGSACRARLVEPSPVLTAMGFPLKRSGSSIRFSLGRGTTRADIDYAVKVISAARLEK